MSLLQEAGALEKQLNESQMCPLCNYTDIKTLTPERIQEIESWAPTIQLLNLAEQDLSRIINEIKDAFAKVESTSSLLIPSFPSESEWTISDSGAKDSIKEVINKLREVLQKANSALEEAISKSKFIMELGPEVNVEDLGHLEDNLKSIGGAFSKVLTLAEEYSLLYDRLDQTIGSIAKEDSAYNLQALWINCVNEVENILKDLLWEQAKKKASKELELIRNELINIRQQLLESQRNSFNSGMTAIWRSLRCDSYSTFSKLLIPEPHGKGYPIEIEVKAQIDDGNTVQEVDVLKVFSESQVNALAIAAFVTRSKMVGHKMLIFDDPVQSMDEEHFKTFASSVITELLQTNFQVVILTHNDTFARQVSYAHHDLSTYLTMSIRHSKKAGCLVEEGNRRVFERLKKAESQADDGNLDEAWKSVRLAIERLYTVVYMKYGPQRFNPLSWIDQTAEYMWDDGTGKGVGVIIEQKIPGTGKRLKEILGMTVAGAHDKAPNGLTDLRNATRDLRDLLSKLQIGG
jgi:wobble nucleotide-excising tRNase